MKLKKIQTNDDLKFALMRVEELWDSKFPREMAEFNALAILISDYEDNLLFLVRRNL